MTGFVVQGHNCVGQIERARALCFLVHARFSPVYRPLNVFPVMLRVVEQQDGGRSGWI